MSAEGVDGVREAERGAECPGEHEGARAPRVGAENVRVVRVGHGANCSSVGSVIDTLFLGATMGGAILAAVLAAMKNEGVTIVGGAHDDARENSGDGSGGAA